MNEITTVGVDLWCSMSASRAVIGRSTPMPGRARRHSASAHSLASVRSPQAPSLPPSRTHATFATVGRWPPGAVWYRSNRAPAAKSDSARSPNAATYLRGLLTQGARSTLQAALTRTAEKRSRLEHWIVALHARVGYHKTLVAIANKHARIIWAILAKGEHYDPDAWQRYAHARH